MMKKLFLLLFLFFLNSFFSQTPLNQFGSDIFVANYPDTFGLTSISKAISGDGQTVIVSSCLSGNGVVKVFNYNAGVWQQLGSDIIGETLGEEFGSQISISDDGLTIAIGAYKKTTATLGWGTGYVKIYSFISGNWVQKGASLYGQNVNAGFGKKVCLSGDGNSIVIAANYTYPQDGYVSVFKFSSGNWSQNGTNTVGNLGVYLNNLLLDISYDGTRIVTFVSGIGIAVYDLISDQWVNTNNNNLIGQNCTSLNMSGDGNTIIFGTDFNFFVFKKYPGYNWQYSYGENLGPINDVSTDFYGNIISIKKAGQAIKIYRFTNNTWDYFANISYNGVEDFYGIDLSSNGEKICVLTNQEIQPYHNQRKIKVYDIAPLILNSSLFNKINFVIYPNPASNTITISIDDNLFLKKISIYNELGQLVITEFNSNINIQNLSKGIYYCEIETNEGKAIKKLIIN